MYTSFFKVSNSKVVIQSLVCLSSVIPGDHSLGESSLRMSTPACVVIDKAAQPLCLSVSEESIHTDLEVVTELLDTILCAKLLRLLLFGTSFLSLNKDL